MSQNPRQLAFNALRAIHKGAFADVAVDQALQQSEISLLDRRLFTELVYGTIRRRRTLDALIDQFAKKNTQAPDLRLILQLGLYQLRYLDQIPPSAAVDTSVELAKQNKLGGLTGVVNGLLRQYLRTQTILKADPLELPKDEIARLGSLHSYPDWIVQAWCDQFGMDETKKLCEWMNRPPQIDLRVNTLRTNINQVEAAMIAQGIQVDRIPTLPNALRLPPSTGAIQNLPGYTEGWWIVQDSSAQLVGYLVDPHPGEIVADACAAPGGKTLHLAELMHDRGTVWAIDKTASRLKKLQQNVDRLALKSIQVLTSDSRNVPQLKGKCDRVLVDAPCSGLGTLNRHADARWRQTPESATELAQLQQEILTEAATWVKPQGVLVYSTCTLNTIENESVVKQFLAQHPGWSIERTELFPELSTSEGWIKVLPHCHNMDGFFMVKLKHE
ncbi:16S rRNA (cytosine(967)-C(5))-methyltransferase [Leptolyngbya sp. AN03gr2]|uniref:16S rRNA (cytosine(967)-C(5))-methyltransferase n=1 Tax=unclassified Leptolyngbya TaxID=2650499 RepID=UPI003D31C7D4